MFLKEDIELVESEIMEYLEKRPLASDSLDGVTQWWLVQQAIEKNRRLVETALDDLTRKGKVIRKNNVREATYSLNPSHKLDRNSKG